MSDLATSPIVPGSQAQHSRAVLWLIAVVAVGLSLFQLYSAGIQPLGLFYQRSIYLALIMMLAFLITVSALPLEVVIVFSLDIATFTRRFMGGHSKPGAIVRSDELRWSILELLYDRQISGSRSRHSV